MEDGSGAPLGQVQQNSSGGRAKMDDVQVLKVPGLQHSGEFSVSMSENSQPGGRRRGRPTLTNEERRERRSAAPPPCPFAPQEDGSDLTLFFSLSLRRLLSNRLAAKRSYYRRQNRHTNTKQAIEQLQIELKNAQAKVSIFRQLLGEAGVDPDDILSQAGLIPPAGAVQGAAPAPELVQGGAEQQAVNAKELLAPLLAPGAAPPAGAGPGAEPPSGAAGPLPQPTHSFSHGTLT